MVRCMPIQCCGSYIDGTPFCILDLGKIDPELLAQAQAMQKHREGLSLTALWFVRIMEYLTLEVFEERSHAHGGLVYAAHIILNGKDFSLRLCVSAVRQFLIEV